MSFISPLYKTSNSNLNSCFLTYRRIVFASRGEIFGQWNCEFTYIWVELKEKPKVTAKGIDIILKEKEKKFLFGSSSSKKEIHITDKKLAEVSRTLPCFRIAFIGIKVALFSKLTKFIAKNSLRNLHLCLV